MVLSTAIPIVIAAIVIVIISKGMPINPIKPKIKVSVFENLDQVIKTIRKQLHNTHNAYRTAIT